MSNYLTAALVAAVMSFNLQVAVNAAVAADEQSVSTMRDLTVPADQLAAGCRLVPADSVIVGNQLRGGMWAGLGVPINPWSGSDRRIVATIVERTSGVPIVPDAPLTAAESSRYQLRLADGIDEAYAAIYSTDSGTDGVVVYALRPDSALNAGGTVTKPATSLATLKIGAAAVTITGTRGPCAQSIETYLRSLATR